MPGSRRPGRLPLRRTQNGYFTAYNAATGKSVWRSPKLDGTVGSSPIVYRGSDGREYVTLIVGGTSEGGKIAVQNDTVYAFALPSGSPTKTTVLPTVSTATTTTTTTAPPPVTGSAAAGAKLFTQAGCGSCHTLAAANAHGTVGPDLDTLKPTQQQVVVQLTNGGRGMPAFKSRYSAKQISEIAAYVSKSAAG